MKLAIALAIAGLAAPRSAAAKQVVKTVKIVGSDAGACETYELGGTGCDANFVLVAREFADGTVTGKHHDVAKVDAGKGAAVYQGSPECIRIYEDETLGTIGVVAGTRVEDDPIFGGELYAEGDTWWVAARIDGEGTTYYTRFSSDTYIGEASPAEICSRTAEEVVDILIEVKELEPEHVGGQVTIDRLECGDLRSKKKCGKIDQCKWAEDACVEDLEGTVLLPPANLGPSGKVMASKKVEEAAAVAMPKSTGVATKVSVLAAVPAVMLWFMN